MKLVPDYPIPSSHVILARARFTRDMAANLTALCSELGENDSIMVEICDWGIWGRLPSGARLFIGSTVPMVRDVRQDEVPYAH